MQPSHIPPLNDGTHPSCVRMPHSEQTLGVSPPPMYPQWWHIAECEQSTRLCVPPVRRMRLVCAIDRLSQNVGWYTWKGCVPIEKKDDHAAFLPHPNHTDEFFHDAPVGA